jgi:serine/threonine-protein kinase
MVDVLSTNLDGAAGLRAIDPRTVLSQLERAAEQASEPPTFEATMQVARRIAASYAVTGSVVAFADEVRLTADVYDVSTQVLAGRAQVQGSSDSVFSLVDRLSVEILAAGLVQDPQELPRPDLRRATTSSLTALRAYLEGEQRYRRSRWSEAISQFQRAVEIDSSFALAFHRLSLAQGWAQDVASPRAVEYSERAARLADRLPRREALLFRGTAERQHGRLASMRLLEQLVDDYPDDMEAWYQLGEAYYHIGKDALYPKVAAPEAFHRALELDPTFAPSYIHLIDDAFADQDSAGARDLIARYQQVDSAGPDAYGFRLAFSLVWGDSVSQGKATAALDTAATATLLRAYYTVVRSGYWEQVLALCSALLAPRHPVADQRAGQKGIFYTYSGLGQTRKAREALDSWGESSEVSVARFELVWHLAGYGDAETTQRALSVLTTDSQSHDRFLIGAVTASQGLWRDFDVQVTALQAEAEQAATERDSVEADEGRAYAAALMAYASAQRGERQAAIEALQAVLPRLPSLGPDFIRSQIHEILRYELAKSHIEQGDFGRAEAYLKSLQFYRTNTVPAEFRLARGYDGLGQLEKARLHYARVVKWWEDCDPELHAMWEQGRQALQRLTRQTTAG